MEKLYGNGINRRLKPGEEATILENIRKILEKCKENPEFFQYSAHSAVRKILKKCDLEELINYPLCFRQTEGHWKIMATRFRYSGRDELHSKKLEKMLANSQCKNHFLNLIQENHPLVNYLLKYSIKNDDL